MQQELIAKNWRELIRPRRARDRRRSRRPSATGSSACEPLERGFGLTLGNALRRVLLSSLQGAAITSVKIDGVLHEFSTIPGVLEDVADIVLNLKEVRLRLHARGSEDPARAPEGRRACSRAGDLVRRLRPIEVMNPEHKIATLSADADVELELTVDTGKGYVGAPRRTRPRRCRSARSRSTRSSRPVRKVNYTRDARARRSRDRLRPADARGLDRRRARAGRRASPSPRRS